jgi:aspartate/methionine/tyrosine aminotransferase
VENLTLADPFFTRWQSLFRWNRPVAGSVALVGLRSGSAKAFAERLVSESGVLLLPSLGLGFGDGHLRFGFGRASFTRSLAELERCLTGQSERT